MLLFVWQFDPRGNKLGGVGKYILSFLKCFPTPKRVGVLGVTTIATEVGHWKKIKVHGKEIDFLPICHIKNENVKQLVPLALKFSFAFLRYRKKIPKDACLFHQRLEYIIPSLYMKNKQYSMIHFDLYQYLDGRNGESYWRKAPWIFNRLISYLLKHSEKVFSVNSNSVQYLNDNFALSPELIHFAPTWSDQSIFKYDGSLGHDDLNKIKQKFGLVFNSNIILVIGRLNKQKNIELIYELVAKVPNTKVVIVGDGPSKKELINKMDAMKLNDKIIFLGKLTQQEIKELFYLASVYLSTSKTEGMSVALLESLSMGVPVVTTPTGESKAIISTGVNGFVSSGWEADELSKFINEILNNKEQYDKEKIIKSANRWSSDKTIPKILNEMDL